MEKYTSEVIYIGDLRTKAQHIHSGIEIITDAPTDNQGKGEAFSPTDLVATALASCMLTTMGIVAARHKIHITGVKTYVKKIMTTEGRRRISAIHVSFDWDGIRLNEDEEIRLKNAALTCPVSMSLDPEIKQIIDFNYTS